MAMRFDVAALLSWLRDAPAGKIGGLAAVIAAAAGCVVAFRKFIDELRKLAEALIRFVDSLERLTRRCRRFYRFLRGADISQRAGIGALSQGDFADPATASPINRRRRKTVGNVENVTHRAH